MANQDAMMKFMNSSLFSIRKIINTTIVILENNTNDYIWFKQIMLSKIIEEQYRPSIQPASEILSQIIPLIFAILSINEFCTQKGMNDLGPISIHP